MRAYVKAKFQLLTIVVIDQGLFTKARFTPPPTPYVSFLQLIYGVET
jgi:hypothetical protein